MSDAARKRETYADLLALPENVVGEIINGELIASPRPAAPHAHAASTLSMDIGSPFQRGRGGPGGWWLLVEPELHLGEDVLVPDLAAWRRERLPRVPRASYLDVSPDWVCEIISASTARLDRAHKLPIYGSSGVKHAWIVDPEARTLEVFRHDGEHWVLIGTYSNTEQVRAEPFDAVELELGALWTGEE